MLKGSQIVGPFVNIVDISMEFPQHSRPNIGLI